MTPDDTEHRKSFDITLLIHWIDFQFLEIPEVWDLIEAASQLSSQ